MSLKGKVALITGGSTGVGKTVGIMLAKRGATIVINHINTYDHAVKTAEEIKAAGGEAMIIEADISNDSAVKEMAGKIEKAYGKVDFLVYCAGTTKIIDLDNFEAITDEIWDKIFDVNIKGFFYCARAVIPLMKKGAGCSIVSIGSTAGINGVGSSIPYALSKASVHCLTKTLARVLAPDIRVNSIAPAAISTTWRAGEEERMQKVGGNSPLQRISSPEDIAELICVMLTQPSLTGQIISPNNGLII